MKILSLKVQNFKTFGPEGIFLSMTDLCALIGENNTGKSNILEAIDLFFNFSKAKISKACFHHDDLSKDIIIEVSFCGLSEDEKKKFSIHLDEKKGNLTITQKISLKLEEGQSIADIDEEDYDFEESKHGTKWEATIEWAKIGEKLPTRTNIKKWWKEDLSIGVLNFKSLFDDNGDEPLPNTYQEKLDILWDEHFDTIPKQKVTGNEKVLGWKNKLKGNLPKFFYVPAVKHVDEDLRVLKTNPFGEMINWLTQNISDDVKKEFEEKTKTIVQDALSKIDQDDEGKSKIAFINKQLNANLGVNLDCRLELKFGTPKISDIVFPSPQLYADDGYYSDVNSKGHGLQRLCILSLLRTYNDIKKITAKGDDRNMILGIEEPEIYLHPPIKRATYKLLRSLSKKDDQIIYSTHDSYFVDVEHFDEIRLFKKVKNGRPKTLIYEFPIDRLVQFYKDHYKRDVDEKSLRHRFGHVCDETKNEGFFANKVILIEGDTEKYALPIYFEHKDFDLDNERISIISTGSADNITYLYVMFNEFHIPCYVIFDGDKPIDPDKLTGTKKDDAKNKSRRNKEILELVGEQADEDGVFFFPKTSVKEKYAVWEKRFEDVFHTPLENYEEIKGEAKKLYGTESKPLTGRYFADVLTSKFPQKISPYVDKLIEKIKDCSWEKSCLG